MKRIRVAHYGLGPIGIEAAKLAVAKKWLQVVAAVEVDPEKIGKELGELLGTKKTGVTVSRFVDEIALSQTDVVLHSTSSRFRNFEEQISDLIGLRANVVSSSEELFFPTKANAERAKRLDRLAKKNKVTVLGTGVNPGFVMDSLVTFLSSVQTSVQKISATRIVDVSTRRKSLQEKVGVGISPEEFARRAEDKALGHVGLLESLTYLSDVCGLEVDTIDADLRPVLAEETITQDGQTIEVGRVTGIDEILVGKMGTEERIVLKLQMSFGAPNPRDEIEIQGTPGLKAVIEGGISGDLATAAMLVHSVPAVLNAPPGLLTAKDVCPLRFHI